MTDSGETPDALLRAALTHHRDGRLTEAEALYRRVLAADPRQPHALLMLAMIAMNRPGDSEAEALLLRHLEVDPDNSTTLHQLGRLRQGRGEDREAAALFRRAAAGQPGLAPIFNDLAVSLHRLGQRDEALAALDRCLEIDPDYAVAHDNRGMVLYDSGRFMEAAQAHLMALARTPADAVPERIALLLHFSKAAGEGGELEAAEQACRVILGMDAEHGDTMDHLASILDRLRRDDEALALRNRLARAQGLVRKGRADRPEATILLLGGAGAGHVPTRYLFDPALFATLTLILLSPDQPDAPLGRVGYDQLATVDLVFNLLGEVERDGGQTGPVQALAARLGKPVLNPPPAVARTGRDQAPGLFGDIPGLLVPEIHLLTRAGMTDDRQAAAALARFAGPVLVRPGGAHGGKDLALVDSPADLTGYLATVPADRFLLTAFHDFKGAREGYRKYRFIFIDRQPFPFHLAIADHWLVHYWRAEMGRVQWKRQEEEAFLTDWRQVFGPAAAAVDQVARRLDLDYGGMDCSLLPDGRVLFFEANASMLVHLDDAEAEFPYKHRAVPRIREAITRMVRSRI